MGLRSCAVKRSLFGLRHFSLYSAHCLLLISLLIHCDDVFAESVKYNMNRRVTEISGQVYNLHMIIFYICCAIAAIVFGLMFWSIIHHRKSKGAEPAQFHGSLKIEILWTAIPVVILVAMAIPASKTLIAMEDASKADITVL